MDDGRVGGGPHDFSVSPSPLVTNLGFELGWTGLGFGLLGLGTKGLGGTKRCLVVVVSGGRPNLMYSPGPIL